MEAGVATEHFEGLQEIIEETRRIAEELLEAAKLDKKDILVAGCSSSEIASHRIGTFSSGEIGRAVFQTLYDIAGSHGIYLAAQCCEHLNRALVLEEEAARHYRLPIVNAVPQLKAGGAFAAAAYQRFEWPRVVESVQAQAGIDIGDTLIGMHLVPVAVPVRTSITSIGKAHVVCARTRPKYIGGERTHYR